MEYEEKDTNKLGDMPTIDWRIEGYPFRQYIVYMKYRMMFRDCLIHSSN